jgi:hypothetical protein
MSASTRSISTAFKNGSVEKTFSHALVVAQTAVTTTTSASKPNETRVLSSDPFSETP